MATWYTDVAANQKQNINFPGRVGVGTLTTQPNTQNIELLEGPPEIVATYTWVGTEAASDIINIAKLEPGYIVDPNGRISTGLSCANVSSLTVAIGDNDLAPFSVLPITNPTAVAAQSTITQTSVSAPAWVSATVYAIGNVVYDTAATPNTLTYTCIVATTTSQTTAPHSDTTYWAPNYARYSNATSINGNWANVSFANGMQMYGGPLSVLPNSIIANSVPGNATAGQLAHSQYQIQGDCWLQAYITAATTANIVANTATVFRVPLLAAN